MESPGHPKRFTDLDKKSNEELVDIIRELTRECEEKQKSCAKLQEEVQIIECSLTERKKARTTKMTDYSKALTLLPLADKVNSGKHQVAQLEAHLREANESTEQQQHRRDVLRAEVRQLQAERVRLHANHAALVENISNVKSQVPQLEKATVGGQEAAQASCSRPVSRRVADEQLDELVRHYLPERVFKSRRRDHPKQQGED